jgi:hypothetical protein
MLLPAEAIAFSVAYSYHQARISHYPCGRYYHFGGVKPAIPCWPSLLFASKRHHDEQNNITEDYYLARSGQDDDADTSAAAATITVSSSSIIAAAPPLNFGTQLKRAIFGSRRRGLPRTITTNKSNIQQHVIHLLSRLGRESCLVTILLLLLYRILTTTTSFSQTLHKFITTNVTRWMVVSLTLKLITLQSQVVTVMDPTTSLAGDANHIDSDWFLKGQFYMKLQNDTASDGDLLSSSYTLYNNTAFAADDAAATSSPTVLVRIRQVPSDGSCLFHAIGARILYDNLMHSEYTTEHNNNISTECNHPQKRQHLHHHPPMSRVIQYSQELRQQAVNALQYNPQRHFTMSQGEEPITASSLVELAAEQYDISSEEYLTSMRDESVWGGGPEIIALASELKRQVVVLEPENIDSVVCSDVHFLARLGDASNDGNNPIYILCTNQQFPESFGRGRVDNNHFLAVFPLEPL